MNIKFHYSSDDDVLTMYTDQAPSETIEVEDFLNIDINKQKRIVGIELFDASEFFGKQNQVPKHFLENLAQVNVTFDEWRNAWFITLELIDTNQKVISQKLPPLKKSEYVSPLIASA